MRLHFRDKRLGKIMRGVIKIDMAVPYLHRRDRTELSPLRVTACPRAGSATLANQQPCNHI